jgi:hypothetical protein
MGILSNKKKLSYTKISFIAIVTISSFVIIGCNDRNEDMKFEKNKWSAQTDPAFPPEYRPRMLTDLTQNYQLRGLKYSEVTNLLGIPDSKDSNSLTYKIIVEYRADIDPVYTKDLHIYFSKDSIITSFDVKEWKK